MAITEKSLNFIKDLKKNFHGHKYTASVSTNYEDCLNFKLKEFFKICKKHDQFENLHNQTEPFVDEISQTIIESVRLYLSSNPAGAYHIFNDGMKNYLKLFGPTIFKKSLNLFRLRRNESYAFSKKDLFHIPYNKRRLVSACRYSLLGSPTLYLSDSINLCYGELNKNNESISNFSVSIFYNKVDFKLITLIDPSHLENIAVRNKYFNHSDLSSIIAIFPLTIACSFQTLNPHNYNFNPEYIIPQMLLTFVSNESNIDGIRYRSTHTDSDYYNYAFPAKTPLDKNSQSCHLKNIFEWSIPKKICEKLNDYGLIESELKQEICRNQKLIIENFKSSEAPFKFKNV